MSPTHIDHTASACLATREVLDRVGDKWSLLVVFTLRDEPVRFNELKRRIAGISQRMLTLTLRNLERDGLVTRTVYPEIPPRVEYQLTPLGQSLQAPISALWAWAEEHQGEVQSARLEYDGLHDDTADQHPPERRYAIGEGMEAFEAGIRELVRLGQEDGSVRLDLDAAGAARAMVALLAADEGADFAVAALAAR